MPPCNESPEDDKAAMGLGTVFAVNNALRSTGQPGGVFGLLKDSSTGANSDPDVVVLLLKVSGDKEFGSSVGEQKGEDAEAPKA